MLSVTLISIPTTSIIAIITFSTAMTKEIINHAEDSTSFLKGSINSEATHRFLNFQTHINKINLLNSKNFMNTNSDYWKIVLIRIHIHY